jgi:hypothetical protein
MNTQEKTFNNWLRTRMPGDYMRVENITMQGVPDINCCWEGNEIWIESKIYYPKHKSPLLEPEQYAWGTRRTMNGGTVWVLALDVETDLIYAYRHRLIIEPAATKYVRILSASVRVTIPKGDLLSPNSLSRSGRMLPMFWKTLFNN